MRDSAKRGIPEIYLVFALATAILGAFWVDRIRMVKAQAASPPQATQDSWDDEIQAIAQDIETKYRIPAKITIWHASIESDKGRSRIAQQANNLFGIHADDAWLAAGRPAIQAGRKPSILIRAYPDRAASADDWALMLHKDRYRPLLKAARKGRIRTYRAALLETGYTK